MRTFLTQIIILLLLLYAGFVMVKYWGQNDSKKIGLLQAEVQSLNAKNEELLTSNQKLTDENDYLKLANQFLKTDSRTARIEVLDQKSEEKAEGTEPSKIKETRVRFTEFNPDTGSMIAKPLEFTISGDLLYVDALVVKFEDVFIESSDVLKNRSLVSFQRVFGENQSPASGFRIDSEEQIPAVYSSGNENETMKAMEKKIWKNFWEISNSPEKQKELGIRAIHGEAPFQRLQPGRIYYLELRASDGLSFKIQ